MKLIETEGCIQTPCPTWDAEVGFASQRKATDAR